MKFPVATIEIFGCIAVPYQNGNRAGLPKLVGRPTILYEGEVWPCSRLSYHLNKKRIKKKPDRESYALHKCDNGWCVNPDHIYLGSRYDNARDSATRSKQFKRDLNDQRRKINEVWPHAAIKKCAIEK